MNKNIINIGRKLSYILRHDPKFLDKNGWVNVDIILNELNISKKILDEIVETNNKKRFSYNEDQTKIRANQGHTVNVDVELEETIPPLYLFHGTSPKYIISIVNKGLQKMKRQHVHLSSSIKTAKEVGKRHSKELDPSILIINSKKMYDDGYKFFLSKNDVWLTDNVPSKYIRLWG